MIDFTKKPENEWFGRPRYYVEIISVKEVKNQEKFDVWNGDAEKLQDATRMINTFKPKKGYSMVMARIDHMAGLADYDPNLDYL